MFVLQNQHNLNEFWHNGEEFTGWGSLEGCAQWKDATEFPWHPLGSQVITLGQAQNYREADSDNDEFNCDRCHIVFDNDLSNRVGKDELYCDVCAKLTLSDVDKYLLEHKLI